MNNNVKNNILCGIFAALIAVGAFIKIPIPICPFTLQFLFTNLAGLLLGKKVGSRDFRFFQKEEESDILFIPHLDIYWDFMQELMLLDILFIKIIIFHLKIYYMPAFVI